MTEEDARELNNRAALLAEDSAFAEAEPLLRLALEEWDGAVEPFWPNSLAVRPGE